ncbi:hypothetical protein C6341_g4862 [Phytophthora cactorum]|nr:hypothetical protein C6341_g4862 [Phytophthora cactorum]
MKFTALQISSRLTEVTSRGKHGDGMGHWQFFYHSICILPRPAQEQQPATGKASATPLPQPPLPPPPRTRPPQAPPASQRLGTSPHAHLGQRPIPSARDEAQTASFRLLQLLADPKCKQEGGACEAAPAA